MIIFDAIAKAVLGPVLVPIKLGSDIAHGRNVFDSVTSASISVATPLLHPVLAPAHVVKDVALGRSIVESVAVNFVPGVSMVRNMIETFRGGRVLILDASDERGVLGWSWDVGSILVESSNRFDFIIRARNWEHVCQELHKIADGGHKIREVQFWGHGHPGAALIGNDAFNVATLQTESWMRLAQRHVFQDGALWWWRTCQTCRGMEGREFSQVFVNMFGIRMAGHTVVIHVIHGCLVCLKPGEQANWKDDEGEWCLATDMGHPSLGNCT